MKRYFLIGEAGKVIGNFDYKSEDIAYLKELFGHNKDGITNFSEFRSNYFFITRVQMQAAINKKGSSMLKYYHP